MNIVKKFFNTAKIIAQRIINILIRILLGAVYLTFIAPFGIFARLFKDYLDIKGDIYWRKNNNFLKAEEFLRKQ